MRFCMKKIFSFSNDIYNFAVGFFIGGANVIPGVSGGTMLFIMGAFEKLISAISDIASVETVKMLCRLDFKGIYNRIQWRFLIGLGLGILVSFATLAKLFVWLLKEHQSLTFAFFFGLIVASIISVNRQIEKWTAGAILSAIFGTVVALIVVFAVPVNIPNTWYMMIICGAICIIAMILPGLSGSFLMLLLGQYDRVWGAIGNISHFDFSLDDIVMLLFLSFGAVIGLGSFVHLLKFLMRRYYTCTVASLVGFMLGSLPRIWPFQHDDPLSIVVKKGKLVATKIIYELPKFDMQFFWALASAVAGLLLVLAIEYIALKKQQKAE